MSEANRLPPTFPDHPVWASLSHYTIGPEDAVLPFAARLARENGWSTAYAARVIEEYKRFCFLAVTGDSEVTPSDAVDQAWHLHLTYSRDYWDRFCPEILGSQLHHGPTAGGGTERHRSDHALRRDRVHHAHRGRSEAFRRVEMAVGEGSTPLRHVHPLRPRRVDGGGRQCQARRVRR